MLRVVAGGGGGVVEVHHSCRQIGRQPVFHQGGEKQETEQWSDDHAEQVHRLGGNAENFSSHHFQVTLIGGCRHVGLFFNDSRHTRT